MNRYAVSASVALYNEEPMENLEEEWNTLDKATDTLEAKPRMDVSIIRISPNTKLAQDVWGGEGGIEVSGIEEVLRMDSSLA